MKKKSFFVVTLILLLSLLSTTVQAATGGDSNFSDLISGQVVTVAVGDWPKGSNSTLDINLSNVPVGIGIENGTYAGWCIQDHIFGSLHSEPATLYSSMSLELPADLTGLPWNEINYVLNHKIRGAGKTDLEFFKDVQVAIWLLLGDTNPEFDVSPEAEQMVADAQANSDFVPGDGEIVSVIVYSDGMSTTDPQSKQENIIEVILHLPKTDTPTATLTNTATFTPTHTATNTPTSTGTITETFTPTLTPTDTATNTPTSTGTITETFTPTFTPTNTLTNTPTSTGTITETFTPTFTPTSTATPTATATLSCQPTIVVADFSKVATGASVEGMGKVASGLNIDAKGTAIRVTTGVSPVVYGASNQANIYNGLLSDGMGFSDYVTKTAQAAHQYTFTFAAGTSVSNFSVRMLDFGDFNPQLSKTHLVSMTAYDAANTVVAVQKLSYTTPSMGTPRSSDLYGDLWFTGDASAAPGQPGNWTWDVSGTGIVKVVLSFGAGFDPNIGFDTLKYTTQCP